MVATRSDMSALLVEVDIASGRERAADGKGCDSIGISDGKGRDGTGSRGGRARMGRHGAGHRACGEYSVERDQGGDAEKPDATRKGLDATRVAGGAVAGQLEPVRRRRARPTSRD